MINASSILATTAEPAQLESTPSPVLAKEVTSELIASTTWFPVLQVHAKMGELASIPIQVILADVLPITTETLVQKV